MRNASCSWAHISIWKSAQAPPISVRKIDIIGNDETRMTNDDENPNAQMTKPGMEASFHHSDFVIRDSSLFQK